MRSPLRGWTSESLLVLVAIALSSAWSESASAAIVVDNQDSGFTILGGTWSIETTPVPFGDDYRSHAAGVDTDRVWFTPDLPLAGSYQVFLTWPDVPTEDTVAVALSTTADVVHSGGTNSVDVGQRNPPNADLTISGTDFELLGVFSFLAGTSGYVDLSANAGGIVMADAVAFNLIPEPSAFVLVLTGTLMLSRQDRRRRSC